MAKRRNCPNCGAPVEGKVCLYCGTVHAVETESVTIEYDPEFVDIMDWSGQVLYRVMTSNEIRAFARENCTVLNEGVSHETKGEHNG